MSVFGLRQHPGWVALALFRLPLPLYRRGWGWLLGRTFLLLIHAGRKTGRILGWDDLRSDTALREFVRSRPFVAFRPSRQTPSSAG